MVVVESHVGGGSVVVVVVVTNVIVVGIVVEHGPVRRPGRPGCR